MQALSTAHGTYGRHIRFCYRNRQVTRWRSSRHDYCPDYGGWWPPQNLGRSSISRRSMVLSEGERTITTRSFNIGLHTSVWRWNKCVGATSRYRTTETELRILELLYLSTVSTAASARRINPRHHSFPPPLLLHPLSA